VGFFLYCLIFSKKSGLILLDNYNFKGTT